MTKPEARVLIDALSLIVTDLNDLHWSSATPLHVVMATEAHIKHLQEAAAELRRIHGVAA